MLKLRCAVGLAVLTGLCTLLSGFANYARPTIVLYRTAVSMLIFAIIGFGVGLLWERFSRERSERIKDDESLLDNENEATEVDIVQEDENLSGEESFDELTVEDFENISHPK